jgi:hypothetical protein
MAWSAGRAFVVVVLSTATLWSIPDSPAAPTGAEPRQLTTSGHFEVDLEGNLRSVEPLIAPTTATPVVRAPGDVFALHSRPGSPHTIYLDFDGHTAEHTEWRGGARIDAPPYDADGDPSTFGTAERDTIYEAYLATAENFRPFDVDVTTQAPDEARITRTDVNDAEFGARVVITPVDATGCGCGGQSYIGVFDKYVAHQSYQPSWSYTGAGSTDGKLIGETASHEAGHTLGLLHDGTSGTPYYPGHENWAPTMGAAQDQPITQWSKGEYHSPTNRQDDIKVMAGKGAPLAADDFTTPHPYQGPVTGVIGTDADTDVFLIHHDGGPLRAAATPAAYSPNLDIRLTIRDGAGHVVATADPPVVRYSAVAAGGMDAQYSADLPAGDYSVEIEGVGYGDPGTNGYTGYGSIGQYTLTVG